QYANLRDRAFFPDYAGLPDEQNIDPTFYRCGNGLRYTPQKNWCFFAQIVSIEYFTRLVLTVKSGHRSNVRIAFYTDDEGRQVRSQGQVGYTIAIMHANQHYFLDGSTGVRVEVPITVQMGDTETACHGCDAQKTSMQKCGRCSMFYYCDKNCQTAAWNGKGHKKDCKIIKNCGLRAMFSLDWSHFDGYLGFPL
ncbi:hypothetical protein QBC37DRAFT_239295, partial [Rhypophila decipiens]